MEVAQVGIAGEIPELREQPSLDGIGRTQHEYAGNQARREQDRRHAIKYVALARSGCHIHGAGQLIRQLKV